MGVDHVVPRWVTPTRRAIDWAPLTLITAALLATATLLGWRTIEVPAVVQYLAVAGLGAAAVLGLGDPARPLLQALPTPPLTRLAHRAVLLVGATALAASVVVAGERLLGLSPTADAELAVALIALAAVGTAVHAALGPIIDHANEAAAGSILLWVGVAGLAIAFIPDAVAMAWLNHPWQVSAISAVVIVGVTNRRSA